MSCDDSTSPLVSVVILNYKRREALEQCVQSVIEQTYVHREVIVVDNHSQDGAEEFVRTCDPGIKWIGLEKNLGACVGRNAGIRAARGEIIVMLDNDVLLATPSELQSIVEAFARRPDAHVLSFQVCDKNTGKIRGREWCHARSKLEFGNVEFETSFFCEGASAFRQEAFAQAGLYYEPFFIGCEGGDLALRILDKGLRIVYCPSVRVYHLMEPETRTADRPYYFYTRNYIWIACKDYPLLPGARYLLEKLLMMFYFTLRTKQYWSFVRAIRDAIAGLPLVRRSKTTVSLATIGYVAALEKQRPNWITRLARHRLQPEI